MNNWQYVLLAIILILALNLRMYHIDYPSIGYHNMKENEYFGEAQVMYETGDYIHTRVMWKGLSDDDYIQEALPVLPWFAVLSWKISGVQIFIPRLLIVISSLASVVLMYFISMQLSKKQYMALTSALLFSFMPLGVFFGRNFQPDMPSLALILLFVYFFLRWLKSRNKKDLIWFSSAIAMAGLIKITSLIGLVFIVFLLPYKDLLKNYKRYLPAICIFTLIMLSIPAWIFISKTVTPTDYGVWSARGSPVFEIFSSQYWSQYGGILKNYAAGENFTAWYLWFSIFGLAFAILKRKTRFSRFIFGYLLALVPYAMILSVRIRQHNYYQMPFLPLVCLLSAYFLFNLGSFGSQICGNFTKNRILKIGASLIPLLLIIPTIGAVQISTNRQFDMLFIGYDVAGNYIEEHSNADERIFLEGKSAGQGASLFGAANRFGVWMPNNLSIIKEAEKDKDFRWIVLYNELWRAGRDEGIFMVSQKPDIWQHIQDNYQVRQVGFIGSGENAVRVFMVLEKSGPFNESSISTVPKLAMTYELTRTEIPLYTVESP